MEGRNNTSPGRGRGRTLRETTNILPFHLPSGCRIFSFNERVVTVALYRVDVVIKSPIGTASGIGIKQPTGRWSTGKLKTRTEF